MRPSHCRSPPTNSSAVLPNSAERGWRISKVADWQDPVIVARGLADTLDSADLPYAIGGALALGYYTAPRGGVDVDINIFIAIPNEIDKALACLIGCGFEPDDLSTLHQTARDDGQFRGHLNGMRIDVFVPAIDLYASLEGRRRQVLIAGRSGWILGPQDLAILKMTFFRRKDLADVEALVQAQGANLDLATVRGQLVDLMGEGDERVCEWDAIVADINRTNLERSMTPDRDHRYALPLGHRLGEYRSALSAFQHSAQMGNPDAQYCLGRCYHDGKEVLRDHAEAAHRFLEAAEQGHADAQHSLGLLCYSGQGIPKDDAQAAQWFRKAADQRLRYAQECLGLMCLRGEGMPKDYKAAAWWLTRAADQGQDISFTLEIGWETGKGKPEVTAEVVNWFHSAAEEESTDAQVCLGLMYSRGQGVPQDFDKAFHWFESAASRGYASAEYYLGQDYSLGLSEPHDYAEAIRWFQAASAHGHSGARLKLHSMYENGDGVPKDDEQVVLWFRRAAEGGCANAQYCLGKMFLSGDRVPDDDGQAIFWIRRAAQQGLADAQYHLGKVLLSGQLVLEHDRYNEDVTGKWLRTATEQQRSAAIQWIRKAAEQGLVKAQYHLGCMYRTDHYVQRDQALAVQWLLRAAGDGHYGAERDLHILLHHVWIPAEETGLSPEMRRALMLPGHSPRDEFELLDRLRAKLKWLIEDSKEHGDFDEIKLHHRGDHPWIQFALNDCLSNTEDIEASWTMQFIAKQALQQGASEPTEDDYGQLEHQWLRDWLNDLNEGLRHWDPGDP